MWGRPARTSSGVKDRFLRFDGLISVPFAVQNTRPLSSKRSPSPSISSSWRVRCPLRASVASRVSFTVLRTCSLRASRSRSSQRSASSSPWRKPVCKATTYKASSLSPCTVLNSPRASSRVSGVTSCVGTCGGSTSSAGFFIMYPHRTACLRRVMCNELDQQVRQVAQRSAEGVVDPLSAGVCRHLGGQARQQPSQRLGPMALQSEEVLELADDPFYDLTLARGPAPIGLRPRSAGVVLGGGRHQRPVLLHPMPLPL